MSRRRSAAVVLGLTAVLAVGVEQGFRAATQAPAARPDLQGIWQAMNSAEWNLEPHEGRPGVPAGTGVVVGGPIPYLPEALKKRQENFKQRDTADPVTRCFMPGVPRATYMGFPFQIIQTDEHVLMLHEFAHTVRVIPTTGTAFEFDGAEFWMGESRGRYEGNSLVIESRNFNDASWFDRAGNFHSEALRVRERFTKAEPHILTYEAVMEDPKVFSRPWTISMPLYRRREANIQLLEYECFSFPEGGFEPPTGAPASTGRSR